MRVLSYCMLKVSKHKMGRGLGLRSDRGREYESIGFNSYVQSLGIIHETTPPYSPASNELFFILWPNILWFVWVLYCSVCICEYLFKTLNVVLLNYLRFWMLCYWVFIWDFKCCVVEYLFKTLNVGMCSVVVFVLIEWCSVIFILWMGVLCIRFICLCCIFIFIFLWERNNVINIKTFFS